MKNSLMVSSGQSQILSEVQACLSLALPLAAVQLAQAATAFADTVMMGWLGTQELAAGGLGSTIFSFLLLICIGVVSAVSPIVAEAYGAQKLDRVGKIGSQSLWLSFALTIACTLLLWNVRPVMQALGQDASNIQMANAYLRAIVWGFFPAVAFAALKNVVSSLSRPRAPMVIMVVGVLFNIVANYVLMFGKFGFPALGLAGIGWASTMTYWGTLLALIGFILSQPNLRAHNPLRHLFQVERSLLKEIVWVGLPIGVLYAVETGLFTVTTLMMGYLGTTDLAAHQIALRTSAIAFMVPAGMSQATTIQVGQFLGQQEFRAARRAGYISLTLGGLFMGVMALSFWLFPTAIISLYINVQQPQNAEVVKIAMTLLSVAAMFQLFDGIQIIAAGALRGLKDTQAPMLIGIFSYWCIGVTGGWLMGFKLGLGGAGLWGGLAIGLATAALIFTWRFHCLASRRISRPL